MHIMPGSQFFRVPFRVVFLLRSQHLCPLLSRFHRSLAAEGVKELLRPLIPFLGVSLTHSLTLSLSLSSLVIPPGVCDGAAAIDFQSFPTHTRACLER